MAKIELRDYQKEAVAFTQKCDKSSLCMRVGSGKTICAMFAIRNYINKKQVDKVIISCTKSSVSVFHKDFGEKAGIKPEFAETTDQFFSFLASEHKICVVKHSMFEKLGNDMMCIKKLKKLEEDGLKVGLIIDEAHKMQNTEGVIQDAFHRIDFFFKKIVLLTATPYSSCLTQLFGLVSIIYPNLWKGGLREFTSRYIEEIIIRDPSTFRPVKKEKISYRNLKELREKIEPFTYFYYPPIPLVHIEYKTRLKDYTEYNDLCKGILTEEEIEKIKEATKNDM